MLSHKDSTTLSAWYWFYFWFRSGAACGPGGGV